MTKHSLVSIHRFLISGLSIVAIAYPAAASADVYVRVEGPAPPRDEVSLYSVEVEPHFSFGAENVYGTTGFGAACAWASRS